MKILTAFSPGDKAFCVSGESMSIVTMTVGQVRVCITDSGGIDGEEIFDNYKPQHDYKEEYMCIESGIGCGSIWTLGKNLFKSEIEAQVALAKARSEP